MPTVGPETWRPAGVRPVGWRFISLYTLAYASTALLFLAPLLVSRALKVNSLVGLDEAPRNLALVAGVGAAVAIVANPFFGRLSDRTSSPWGKRRPWMLAGLVGGSVGVLGVALADSILFVLLGWCVAQLGFNALFAAMVAVLPDQVPVTQRGLVAGVLGLCLPVASVVGTFLVTLFSGNQVAMFMAPCVVAGVIIVIFAVALNDRHLDGADKPPWTWRELATTFWVSPRKNPDFAWTFASRFMFVLAYAFLTTFLAYYLLDHLANAESAVPQQVFLGTLVQSAAIVAASLIGGRLSDYSGRRKVFVINASVTYGCAMFLIASASDFNGFLVGMALGGLGFGMYMAVDLALAVDVLPDPATAAKDLGRAQHRRSPPQLDRPSSRSRDSRRGRWQLRHPVRRGRHLLAPRRPRHHPRQARPMRAPAALPRLPRFDHSILRAPARRSPRQVAGDDVV